MDSSQVTAAVKLLGKVLPDLSSAEIKQDTTVRYVARIPEKQPDTDSWHQRHAPSLQ